MPPLSGSLSFQLFVKSVLVQLSLFLSHFIPHKWEIYFECVFPAWSYSKSYAVWPNSPLTYVWILDLAKEDEQMFHLLPEINNPLDSWVKKQEVYGSKLEGGKRGNIL